MCNSKNQESSEGTKQSNTNVGLLNMSSSEVSSVGASEILKIIILIILIWIVVKWCCKRRKRQNERRERNLEEVIQLMEARPAAQTMAPTVAKIPPAQSVMSIPAVTFENPGNRVVFLKEKNEENSTEWDRFR